MAARFASGTALGSLLLGLACVAPAGSADAAPAYTLTDLATLQQGHPNVVRGPNNRGRAGGGGRLATERGGRRALVFDGGLTAQQVAGLEGREGATVYRIEDGGAFVGSSNTATAVRAFAGTREGAVRELPPLPGDSASMAFGINSLGQAVGFSSGSGGQRAVLWEAGGAATALPPVPGARSSRANDISIRGDVAGVATLDAGHRPVLWPFRQAPRELQLIAGDSTGEARAVNARGEAVGYTGNASGTLRHAALWAATGAVTSIGTLPGGEFSEALGINDSGAVVGSTGSGAGLRAFLWTRADGLQDLNALVPRSHVVLTRAMGINNAGAIIAVGQQAPPGGVGPHAPGDDRAAHDLPVRVFLLLPVGGR